MTEDSAELPRWGGVTEPMTVATNVVLAVLAFVLAARLAYSIGGGGIGGGRVARRGDWLATGLAAAIGALAHGTDPAA